MRKIEFVGRLILLAGMLLLNACATPRTVPFKESDFAWSAGKGTSTITGRAWVKMQDGTIRYANNQWVEVTPRNAYTREAWQAIFMNGQKMAPADPRYKKYIRYTKTDANGNFAIHNLPAGDWYLASTVNWEKTEWDTTYSADGGLTYMPYHEGDEKWPWNKATVGAGQTVHVDLYY